MRIALLTGIISFVFTINAFGQNEQKIDSLEALFQNPAIEDSLRFQAIYQLIELNLYSDLDQTKSYISAIDKLAKETKNFRGNTFYHHYTGILFSLSPQLDSAYHHFKIAHTYRKALSTPVL